MTYPLISTKCPVEPSRLVCAVQLMGSLAWIASRIMIASGFSSEAAAGLLSTHLAPSSAAVARENRRMVTGRGYNCWCRAWIRECEPEQRQKIEAQQRGLELRRLWEVSSGVRNYRLT